MDSVFAPPFSDEAGRYWDLDETLLPDDQPWAPDDEQPEDPGQGVRPDPGRTSSPLVHGRRACSCLVQVVPLVEQGLVNVGAIKKDLSGLITQQAYSSSVAASATTHVGGGVWDVKHSLVNTNAKRRAWFKAGIIPFDRRKVDAPSAKWPAHGHVVVAGCEHRSRSAAEQEKAARLGLNALRNKGPFRGALEPIITWQQAVAKSQGAALQSDSPRTPVPKIPRHRTPKPWPLIAVDGIRGKQTMDRLRMQLNLKPTGSGKWSHWDVAALLVWLGEPYEGKGIITPLALLKLQYRVGMKPGGRWGTRTTRALQQFLNENR